ncbi:hypothetical protein HMI55_004629, partial [Coelomomyces lativittatus]
MSSSISSSNSSSSNNGVGGSGSRPTRIVFVGNIPWDATEESMSELFQEAGPLLSFRLMMDKDTLKPKGYGFAEYHDIETAKSAVRNLNELDLGGRKLRVDFAESDVLNKSLGFGGGAAVDLNHSNPSQISNKSTTSSAADSTSSTSTHLLHHHHHHHHHPLSATPSSSVYPTTANLIPPQSHSSTPPLLQHSSNLTLPSTSSSSLQPQQHMLSNIPSGMPSTLNPTTSTSTTSSSSSTTPSPVHHPLPPPPSQSTSSAPQSATDAISSVISGMTKDKLTEVLSNVKLLSTTQPEQVRALLSGNPQLTYCLMQMMLVCGLVDPTAIQ